MRWYGLTWVPEQETVDQQQIQLMLPYGQHAFYTQDQQLKKCKFTKSKFKKIEFTKLRRSNSEPWPTFIKRQRTTRI